MVRAHSLLYAIYICLIVSLLCGAMLYMANLYNQLNLHYITHEELYIHNQSLVNYALGNIKDTGTMPEQEGGIQSELKVSPFGLLTLVTASSIVKNDTVTSVHFAGQYAPDDTCLYLPSPYKALSCAGNVTLVGNKKLPSEQIREFYLDNNQNKLVFSGSVTLSGYTLPFINPSFKDFFKREMKPTVSLISVEKQNDSVYFNSFLSDTKDVELTASILGNVNIRGNFILHSRDSIRVQKTAKLEDVILCAPVITFEDGFTGNVQAFATEKLRVGTGVRLSYPSILCLYNETLEKGSVIIKKDCRIEGGITMFGFPPMAMESNIMEIDSGGLIVGDIYCQGLLSLSSDVYGSVYANKIMHKSETGKYENSIFNIEINADKRPDYFVAIPLFKENETSYGLIRKVI